MFKECLTVCGLLLTLHTFAKAAPLSEIFEEAVTDPLIRKFGEGNEPRLIRNIRLASTRNTTQARQRLPDEAAVRDRLGLDRAFYSLSRESERTTHQGTLRVKLRQLFLGVPVYSTNIVVEQDPYTKEYFEDSIQGAWYSGVERDIKDIKYIICEEEAINILKKHNNHEKYSHKHAKADLFAYPMDEACKAALAYRTYYFLGIENMELQETAYQQYSAPQFPKRPTAFVDAVTRKVHDNWEGLASALQPTRIKGVTGNNQKPKLVEDIIVSKESTTNNCVYTSQVFGVNVTLVDYKTDANAARKFQCDDAAKETFDSTNGAYSPMNSAFKYAREALVLMQQTSLNLLITELTINSHYGSNAAFQEGRRVYFSDGNSQIYPWDQADIVAHEIAHAFTERHSGLELTEQPGAINEAYSDMAAMALLDSLFKRQPFEFGRTIQKTSGALRDLCNPMNTNGLDHASKLPAQITTDVQKYAASGIYSKAFCLLAKMPGWDIQSAFKVFTRANQQHWQPKSTFASAACGVREGALDEGRPEKDILAAFSEVGVTCALS